MDILYEGHTLEHWKNNAEEDYAKVPISVLKYITVLEEAVKDSFSRSELTLILNKFGSKVYGEYTRNETMEDFTYNWIEQNL